MKFKKLSRVSAFIYDGIILKEGSDHADLLENFIEDAQDTDDDPRVMFPSGVITGVIYDVGNKEYIYEIVGNLDEEIIINKFLNNICDTLYIYDFSLYDLVVYKKLKEEVI